MRYWNLSDFAVFLATRFLATRRLKTGAERAV
jgi:hypothetical protein